MCVEKDGEMRIYNSFSLHNCFLFCSYPTERHILDHGVMEYEIGAKGET